MTAAVGFPTLRLIRVRVGAIHLRDLLPGEVREVPAFTLIAPAPLNLLELAERMPLQLVFQSET